MAKAKANASQAIPELNISANRDLVLNAMAQIKMYRPTLELQDQFAVFVSQVDKSKVAVQAALDKVQMLFDSLMQRYFG